MGLSQLDKMGLSIYGDDWRTASSVLIRPSGDIDDYFSFTTTSDRPLLAGVGNYLVLGKDATSGHSFDTDDVLFGEDIEVDGMLWADGGITLGGGITAGDQSWTNVGDMTFAAGSILASGSTNGNTLLLRANDTTFLTFTTGATDAMTIANATMSGTWLASGTVTMPALTWGGAISGNAQTLSNANVTVGASRTLDVSAGTLTLADNQISGDKVEGGTIAAITITALTAATITASSTVTCNGNLVVGTSIFDVDSGVVTWIDMPVTSAADDVEESLVAKIDGVEFFRMYSLSDGAGAIDNKAFKLSTYLQLLSTDTDSAVEGQVWYDTSTHTIVYHNGTAVKTLADVV